MTRTLINTVVAGLIAVAALAGPVQAGHNSYSNGHGHSHHVTVHHHVHTFHAYRPVHVHYAPVCVKHEWTYVHGHKKFVCVIWK